jgi:Zn-finger nucleic acid-binding protein
MNCPVCKNHGLVSEKLEDNLISHACHCCGGRWIGSFQYWKWKDASGKSLDEKLVGECEDLPVTDSTGAKLCPECGYFLRRFPVGHDVAFGLDRCGNCGGMWFDGNEWETLKGRGLHDDVHKIFSEIWQKQVRDTEYQKNMEAILIGKFGEDGYAKAKEVKAWLDEHPHKAELLALLKQ